MEEPFAKKPLIPIEKRPLAYIDTEFSDKNEAGVYCICLVARVPNGLCIRHWYNGGSVTSQQKTVILKLMEEYTLVAHYAVAETRFLLSLLRELPPCLQIVDTFADWKLATNKHFRWNWGKQYKKGKVVTTRPPSIDEKKLAKTTEGEALKKLTGDADASLAAMCYKVHRELENTDVFIDLNHKEEMRDICIRGNYEELETRKTEVLEYCEEDVVHLENVWELWIAKSNMWNYSCSVERGDYSISLAYCMRVGIPVDVAKINKLAENRATIIALAKRRFNADTGLKFFRGSEVLKKGRKGCYTLGSKNKVGTANAAVMHEYVLLRYPEWPMSKKKKTPSLSDEHLELYSFDPIIYEYRQTMKSIRALQSLNPFTSTGKEKESCLLDNIGSDSKIRCQFGPFGTQTGRNAPRASVFILAMAKWMRALMTPPKGYAIVEVDYSSQENLLAGIVYPDENIIDGYKSGDVYLAFGKQAGILPVGATKETHGTERQQLKAVVLGCGYGMGKVLLTQHFCASTWKGASSSVNFKEEYNAHRLKMTPRAKELLRSYKETYAYMFAARDEAWEEFEETSSKDYKSSKNGYMPISRNWGLYDGTPFYNSVLNAPVQGIGAEIMRRFSHKLTRNAPFGVLYFSPLHDASYSLVPLEYLVEGTEWICQQMYDAVQEVVPCKESKYMRVGIDVISPEVDVDAIQTTWGKAKVQKVFFADDKAKRSYLSYLPYMITSIKDLKLIWGDEFSEFWE